MSKDRLIIFDTTMRDGEQSPGASMTRDEKIRIARALERLNVDVIEAGFAIASPGDFEAVKAVAETVKNCAVASLARAAYRDIEEAAAALKNAVRPRIHTFIATSPIHMQYKLQMTPEQVLDQAVRSVKQARGHTDDVEFSCEDASRSEFDFLCRIIEAVIAAGATTINLPDTVGYGEPGQYGEFIGRLIRTVPNADKAIFSVHCHNDLGLAVANSLSAVMHGARQVECTINGLGERAGNASLEEIVMAVRTRADVFPVETRIVTEEIVPASRLVSSITGFPVQPNKAIVGANAFAHEAGIHQDGVLKHRETYEIMRAQDVGWSTNRLVLGKHSGRAAVRARFEELGISFETPEELESAFKRFKELADKKHEIFDEDLQAIAGTVGSEDEAERYQFVALEAISHTGEKPRATVTLSIDGVERQSYAEGDGPVDAVFKAIENEVHSGTKLLLFSINAITTGTDSQAEVMVRLERDARIVNGAGADTDIIVASAKAYLHALNVMGGAVRAHPQIGGI
ncbi:MAG: 2-isopropylmalate synthase [Gammaproteobacteria bacterium]|nr:2-isopropylmalate synthase [Gammaproteobacteria bacterium]